MMNIRVTSLILAGLLSAASVTTFAASGDGADATGAQSGSIKGSAMPPDNTPASPSGGSGADGGATGSSSGSSGSNTGSSGSGSGAGGGTGGAGGGTGGAGGGTGS
ncbi:hypothetical protein [Pseudomonas sp. P8_241]|uniref:hypothetical protein n=1 Tax=Pseudomonas sp. P8_241 TaxID=3043445 RepID=UPI002A35AB04|nr:hypothetical protein [Pseudomonas sp. P8_241]WPN49019.1 hypothetical protein QMK58_10225 [Pseudomonas sp. P8_241]